tara:strand:+ start:510 stop:629 length:120 start_codon:yes stop_codon:yes gene_type:complete
MLVNVNRTGSTKRMILKKKKKKSMFRSVIDALKKPLKIK